MDTWRKIKLFNEYVAYTPNIEAYPMHARHGGMEVEINQHFPLNLADGSRTELYECRLPESPNKIFYLRHAEVEAEIAQLKKKGTSKQEMNGIIVKSRNLIGKISQDQELIQQNSENVAERIRKARME
jgi:hypothetical protein